MIGLNPSANHSKRLIMRTTLNPATIFPDLFEVRVNGPDCDPLSDADLRRLFPGSMLTQGRLDRLREWPRVAITCRGIIVAIATCQKVDLELRVAEVGVDAESACDGREVLSVLFDAIELAALAGGCRRVVVNPPKVSLMFLQRRGYHALSEGCAGSWIEKALG